MAYFAARSLNVSGNLRIIVIGLASWLAFLLSSAPAQAQALTVAACGLPAEGTITASVTYTLSADCTQTGELSIAASPSDNPEAYTLTINGNGHTIYLSEGILQHFVQSNDATATNRLVLNNLTLDGRNHSKSGVILGGAVTAQNVTFRNHATSIITSSAVTLTNVLFENNRFGGFGFGANGGTLNIKDASSATVTNAVFRNNRNMNIVLHTGGTLTTTGCLRFTGNLAYDVVHSGVWATAGVWTDNSDSECAGAIGNGGQAVLPAATLLPCGLPAGLALIDVDTTYSLRGHCAGFRGMVVSEGVNVTIRANGYHISGDGRLPAAEFAVAGRASLTVSDAVLNKLAFLNFGTLTLTHSEIRNARSVPLVNYGTASYSNMRIRNIATSGAAGAYYAIAAFESGIGSFSDVAFAGISGGDAALRAIGNTAVVNLDGCITFEGLAAGYPEVLAQRDATVNDNRASLPCLPSAGPRVIRAEPGSESRIETTMTPLQENCLHIGAIGLFCRGEENGEPIGWLWEIISRDRVGAFALGVRQSQVEASAPDLLLCSANGGARVRVGQRPPPEVLQIWHTDPKLLEELIVPRRYITVSMRPTHDGKTLHLIIDNAIDGRVMSQVSTFTPLDCPIAASAPANRAPYARVVQPQAPQADGSIVHIVQPGDNVSRIAIAYQVFAYDLIERNGLAGRADLIYPGETLLIRDAE